MPSPSLRTQGDSIHSLYAQLKMEEERRLQSLPQSIWTKQDNDRANVLGFMVSDAGEYPQIARYGKEIFHTDKAAMTAVETWARGIDKGYDDAVQTLCRKALAELALFGNYSINRGYCASGQDTKYVYVASITIKDKTWGDDTSVKVFKNEDPAYEFVAGHCRTNWKDKMPADATIPSDMYDVVSAYFEHVENESYRVNQREYSDDE